MNKKKWLAVVLAATFAIAVSGCSGNSSNTNNTSEPGNEGTNKKEPVTFTYFNATANKDIDTNKTKIGKILEEQTGVNFKQEFLVGDLQTKIGTMIASNEYPDVIQPDAGIDKIIDAGAFIPLNDLIDKHGPNIKRVYEPYFNLMTADDGNIYFLPFSPLVGEYIPNPTIDQGAFWIQNRVLKEAGYPKIKTLDEYVKLISDYVDKHPDEDTIGMTLLTHDWRFFDVTNPPNHLAGYPNDGGVQVDMKTMEAKVYGDNDDTKRWLQTLNDLNAKGLLDKSSFVDNYDQYLAKLTSGKVLGFFDYGWQAQQAFNTLRSNGKDDLEYFPLPIVLDENIKDQYLDPPSFVNNRGIGISVSAKDPARIIQYFDNLLTDENQKLTRWGIKGETYEVDDKGRLYQTDEQIAKLKDNDYSREIGISYYSYYWPMYGQGSTFPDGNAVDPGRQTEVAQASFTAEEKERLNKYGVETYSEMFAAPEERPWYPAWSIALEQGSQAQIFSVKQTDLQKKYFAKIVLAAPDKFESVWNEYVTEYRKTPVEEYEKTMTEEVKKKVQKIQGTQ
ncbi:ABC transporter substrate-binding protein [Paenibacillus sp. GCM10028914]|uniref:ABC transporter substrate-binding protein n=1 Tax=Paenibacillus sp. GCM10028914 TaxID=3273416 RepID=UPI00360F2704